MALKATRATTGNTKASRSGSASCRSCARSLQQLTVGIEPGMAGVEAHAGDAFRQRSALPEPQLEVAFAATGFDDAIAAGIADLDDLDRDTVLVEPDKLRPHANLGLAAVEGLRRRIFHIDPLAGEQDGAVADLAR